MCVLPSLKCTAVNKFITNLRKKYSSFINITSSYVKEKSLLINSLFSCVEAYFVELIRYIITANI